LGRKMGAARAGEVGLKIAWISTEGGWRSISASQGRTKVALHYVA